MHPSLLILVFAAQTKVFERQSGDAQPNQSKASVAEDLKGLLTGSTRVNDIKGAGSLVSITSVPEVRLSTHILCPKGLPSHFQAVAVHLYSSANS